MKSDNFIRRQRHPSLVPRHAIIDTHMPHKTIYCYSTRQVRQSIARVCSICSPIIFRVFLSRIQLSKLVLLLLQCKFFFFSYFVLCFWQETHALKKQTRRPLTRHSYSAFGCIRSSERPSWPGRTADSFIHSFSHAAFVTFTLHVSIHATFLTNIRAKLHLYLCCGLQHSSCGTCDPITRP